MTSPLTEQQLAAITLAVATAFDQTEPAENRRARWENAAWTAGRTVDRNALAVYLAVADAEHQALAEDWGRAAAAADAEIVRLKSELAKEQRLHGDTIDERDRATDAADKLAYAVAPETVIGEHSADNSPWANAAELVTPAAEVEKLRAALAEAEQGVALLRALKSAGVDSWDGYDEAIQSASV